jgi:hypothetical protein
VKQLWLPAKTMVEMKRAAWSGDVKPTFLRACDCGLINLVRFEAVDEQKKILCGACGAQLFANQEEADAAADEARERMRDVVAAEEEQQ